MTKKKDGIENNKMKANEALRNRGSFHSNKKLSPGSNRQISGMKQSTNIGYWKLKSSKWYLYYGYVLRNNGIQR